MLGVWSFRLLAAAVVLAVVAILLFRFRVIEVSWGLLGLAAACLAMVVALVFGVLGLIFTPRAAWSFTHPAVLGTVGAFVILILPFLNLRYGLTSPAIHDISTLPHAPQAFEAVLKERRENHNALAYDAKVAELQEKHYANIQPLQLSLAPGAALDLAERVAREQGWRIVQVDVARGRLEAVDRSAVFGFDDDVLIWMQPRRDGVLVQMRSASRLGRSDLGKNARRIASYLDALAKAAKP